MIPLTESPVPELLPTALHLASTTPNDAAQLHRTLCVGAAVMMGLGSIVGTGVFV